MQEDSGAKIREWSPSRVAKYISDFADSNNLKLSSTCPRLIGFYLETLTQRALFEIFDDASDLDVLNLFYQIHPTEVTSRSRFVLLNVIVSPPPILEFIILVSGSRISR